jgi:dienelactone hydrolase
MKFTSLFLNCLFSAAIACGQISISTDSVTHISAIWYYPSAEKNPALLLSDTSKEFPYGFKVNVDRIISHPNGGAAAAFLLTPDKTKVLFYIQEKIADSPKNAVDVWSYTDAKTGDWQRRDASIPRLYAMLYDLKKKRLIRLENGNEKVAADYDYGLSDISNIQVNNDFIILYKFQNDFFTYCKNGVINPYYSFTEYNWNKKLSCDAYLVSLENGKRTLIKSEVNPVFADLPYYKLSPGGRFVVYYDGEEKAYICYDVLKSTSRNVSKEISVPLRDSIHLEQVARYEMPKGISGWLNGDSTVVIEDINNNNWEIDMAGSKLPVCRKFISSQKEIEQQNEKGIKRELIRWKSFDGKLLKGVLCKPEDFNPNKKYPLVMVYYEKSMISMDTFMPYGKGDLVDYGYLVFWPDICFEIGETGQSAYNAIMSAAKHLCTKPYIDSKRIGIRGASFAGYQTNYLITHTNLFAAAISMSGYSDFISNNGIEDVGIRPHMSSETGQNRLGASLWERPDVWIKNSPVFYANKVNIPVLLIHSRSDENVPFEQSVEFFKALRRLGKKAWLLQYDNMGHIAMNHTTIGDKKNDDFVIRQLQFFNYYLKGEPAPKWMLDGMPARLKGSEIGLELDSAGRAPGNGLVKDKLALTPAQEDLLKNRTMVTDDGRIIDVGKKMPVKKSSK